MKTLPPSRAHLHRPRVRLVVVGSVALDTVRTPEGTRSELLGGSCSYACLAAVRYVPVGMVGVVGTDFPAGHLRRFRRQGIDTTGLAVRPGATFRWSGVYERDESRRTLETRLNVFADFRPELPDAYREAPVFLLGNIDPSLQSLVLDQARRPLLVAADTMDLWIRTDRRALERLLRRVDILLVNDAEARLLAGCYHLPTAGEKLRRLGPRFVVVKKGEHGAMVFSPFGLMLVPAYPVRRVRDPTGAGDVFAGALLGALAAAGHLDSNTFRQALLTAAATASFAVEAFGVERLVRLTRREVAARRRALNAMVTGGCHAF